MFKKKISNFIEMSIKRSFLWYSKAQFVTLKIRLQLTLEIKPSVKIYVCR